MKQAISLLVALACTEAQAALITVDFEETGVTTERQYLDPTEFDGFTFSESPVVGGIHLVNNGGCAVGCAASGSVSLLYEGIHAVGQPPLVIEHAEPFRLLALDVAEAFPTFGPPEAVNAIGVFIRGEQPDGSGTVVRLDLDGVLDGPGGVADFQHFDLPDYFTSWSFSRLLVWGRYPGDQPSNIDQRAGFSLDNLQFETVPEPAGWHILLVCLSLLATNLKVR